jgi:DoxX-like family
LSAVGVDREAPTDFSRTKLAGDEALMGRNLDWIILRPSVVIGKSAYGASALLRGLAALPINPVIPDTGPLQVIDLDDVVDMVVFFLRSDAPSRKVLELVGPRHWSFEDIVAALRKWLRWPPARKWRVPSAFASLGYKIGDIVSLLGWRPPIRTNARKEVVRGAIGDPAPLRAMGITLKDLEASLIATPSSVQERWFAGLYFLKPLVFIVLSLFWLCTGLISLGPGWESGMNLMREGSVGERVGALTVASGALADVFIGMAIAYRPTSRLGLHAAVVISITYAAIGTILIPTLWIEPLGPMLKIWPIVVLHLVALAILEDR